MGQWPPRLTSALAWNPRGSEGNARKFLAIGQKTGRPGGAFRSLTYNEGYETRGFSRMSITSNQGPTEQSVGTATAGNIPGLPHRRAST